MLKSGLGENFLSFDNEQGLQGWLSSRDDFRTVRQFSFQTPTTPSAKSLQLKLWIVVFSSGSGYKYIEGFIFRESAWTPGRIQCVATAFAILYGRIQIEFDPKSLRVKVYGTPRENDLGYPHETLLIEYCIGAFLF